MDLGERCSERASARNDIAIHDKPYTGPRELPAPIETLNGWTFEVRSYTTYLAGPMARYSARWHQKQQAFGEKIILDLQIVIECDLLSIFDLANVNECNHGCLTQLTRVVNPEREVGWQRQLAICHFAQLVRLSRFKSCGVDLRYGRAAGWCHITKERSRETRKQY